jgi:hypothetical protein
VTLQIIGASLLMGELGQIHHSRVSSTASVFTMQQWLMWERTFDVSVRLTEQTLSA